LDLNLRKKLVERYNLGTAFYGLENPNSPGNRSQIAPTFWNVVLENDGEDICNDRVKMKYYLGSKRRK
jgi:hypothetical protein